MNHMNTLYSISVEPEVLVGIVIKKWKNLKATIG